MTEESAVGPPRPEPPAAEPAGAKPAEPSRRRGFLRRLVGVTRRDAIVVLVISVAMSLSAYAVYQATRAADEARGAYNEARTVDAELNRQSAHLQSLVDSDLRVLSPYCDAVARERSAWPGVLSYETDIETLVSASLGAWALSALLQGDYGARCDPDTAYSVEEAFESLRDQSAGTVASQSRARALLSQAKAFDTHEALLMASGALFALVVALLITIGVVRSRRPDTDDQGRLRALPVALAIAWPLALLAGGVLLAVAAVDRLVAYIVLGAAVVLLALGAWWGLRAPARADDGSEGSPRARLFAELFGALVLVLFSAAAVGYAYLSVQERDATARADAAVAVANDVQQTTRQEAMRDVSNVALIARLDAEGVAAAQRAAVDLEADVPAQADVDARLELLSSDLRRIEEGVRAETRTLSQDRADAACTAPPPSDTPDPLELYRKAQDDATALSEHLWAAQEPARLCDIVAALTRDEARSWASHASTFTVCLVLLGLAAFILGLAADRDRTRQSAWVLFGVGSASALIAVFAMLFAVPDIVARARITPTEVVESFAGDLAAGMQRPCDAADRLELAIAAIPDYAPAYEALALSKDCPDDPLGRVTADSDLDTAGIIADLEQAQAVLDEPSPTVPANLGWYRLLHGIRHDDEESVRRALDDLREARSLLEAEGDGAGTVLHYVRFNEALAYLALGDEPRAMTAYEDATACLAADGGCPGGGLLDDWRRDWLRLMALDDLELVTGGAPADDDGLDDLRLVILGAEDAASVAPPSGLELSAFPLELQLAADRDDDVRIVWYARSDEETEWSVLPDISWATLEEGDHLNWPWRTYADTHGYRFRADVYSGSRRTVIFDDGDSADHRMAASPLIGVSASVPSEWTEQSESALEWHIGPDESSGLWIRRIEAVNPETEVRAELTDELRSWVEGRLGAPADRYPIEAWFLGNEHAVVEWSGDALSGATLKPFGIDPFCGGTQLMAVVGGEGVETEVASAVFHSIVLDRGAIAIPEPDGEMTEAGLSMTFPEGWDVVESPTGDLVVSAGSCTDGAFIDARRYEVWGEFTESLDSEVAWLADNGYVVDDVYSVDVPGAEAAAAILFTWTSASGESHPMWELFAHTQTTEWVVAFEDYLHESGDALLDAYASIVFDDGG